MENKNITHSIKNYRMAKIFIKDIEQIIKQFDMITAALASFGKYRAVGRVLVEIKDNKAVLQSHYAKCQEIVKTKGLVKENS